MQKINEILMAQNILNKITSFTHMIWAPQPDPHILLLKIKRYEVIPKPIGPFVRVIIALLM